MLVPVAWFYFGQTIKPAFLETTFRLVVYWAFSLRFMGCTSLRSVSQLRRQYWIDNTEFYNSISVGNVKRAPGDIQ